jgi:hypothetical protein
MGLKPEQSLAALCPPVAAIWHPTKNRGRTPADTAASSVLKAWWRCPAGHEWREPVNERVRPAWWKADDLAACGECSDRWRQVLFRCGHRVKVEVYKDRPKRQCPDCVEQMCAELAAAYMWAAQTGAPVFAITLAQARRVKGKLTAEAAAALPDALHREWIALWGPRGDNALAGVQADDCRAFQWFLCGASGQLADTIAMLATLENPAVCVGRVGVTDKPFWMAGVRHLTGAAPPFPADGSAVAATLEQRLQARSDAVRAAVAGGSIPAGTRVLTKLIERWAHAHGCGERRWRCHREVFVPVTPAGARLSGIVDLVVERPGLADLVIEVDSTNKARSVDKLRFAQRAGGVPIWVRWRRGPVRGVPGVHVIDLTDCCQ